MGDPLLLPVFSSRRKDDRSVVWVETDFYAVVATNHMDGALLAPGTKVAVCAHDDIALAFPRFRCSAVLVLAATQTVSHGRKRLAAARAAKRPAPLCRKTVHDMEAVSLG